MPHTSKRPAPPVVAAEPHIVRFDFEASGAVKTLQITVPHDWYILGEGLFLCFESPGGLRLEMFPVLRLVHREHALSFELTEIEAQKVALQMPLEALHWEWCSKNSKSGVNARQ